MTLCSVCKFSLKSGYKAVLCSKKAVRAQNEHGLLFYMFGNEHEIFTEWFRLNYTADKVACNAEFIPF